MSDGDRVIELKDALKTFRIKLDDIRTLWDIGITTGKLPEFWIYMNHGEFVLKCIVEKP